MPKQIEEDPTRKKIKLKPFIFEDHIVWQSDDFVVINKPAGLSTLDDRETTVNLLTISRSKFEGSKVCHRLDKDTSGLLVIAKTDEAYRFFSKQLEKREVVKIYHAVVQGRRELNEVEIDKPIYTTSNKSRVDYKEGKPSLTLVTSLDIFKDHTLVQCMPFTGRMHQIRVHLAEMGMPICGDEIYGGEPIFLSSIKRKFKMAKHTDEQPLMSRMSLHAYALQFKLPSGDDIRLVAPYPKDFDALLTQLRKNKN